MTIQNSTAGSDARSWVGARHDAYRAAGEGAVLFDRSREGRLRITGGDRATWLQGLITNDVEALAPGRGCYAAALTAHGRMVSDLRVLVLADALLVDVPTATAPTVRERFEQFVITEDVVIENCAETLARLAIHGPSAAIILARTLTDTSDGQTTDGSAVPGVTGTLLERLSQLDEHASLWLRGHVGPVEAGQPSGVDVLVAGTRELGVSGFDLYVAPAFATALRRCLLQAGALEGNRELWNLLRLEAGTPLFGRDMTDDTIPLEAGIEDRAISFTKGCYVGQEIIIRVVHRGHGRVAKRLVGIVETHAGASVDETGALPFVAGDSIFARDGDRHVGQITSAAFSPALGRAVALAYVQRDFVEPGTALDAKHDSRSVPIQVTTVPFVRR